MSTVPASGGPATGAAPPDLARLRIQRPEATIVRTGGGRWPLVLLILALLGGGAWAWLTGRLTLQEGPGLPSVRMGVVLRPGAVVSRPGEVTGNGYVIARRRAALSTVLSGRLVEVAVEEGDTVAENQVVARIQHDDYDAQLEAARREAEVVARRAAEAQSAVDAATADLVRLDAEIAVLEQTALQAKAEAERAAAELARNEPLARQSVIGQDRWTAIVAADAAARAALAAATGRVATARAARGSWEAEIARRNAAFATAQAQVAQASQAVTQAEILLEKTFVRAPFAGVVVHKDAEVGEVVAATGAGGNSRGSVATIVDPATLEVQVELAETRLGSIGEGDATRIVLDAAPDAGWRGRVRQVWPTADRQKATVEMRVEFLERPPILKPEMGARVAFLAKDVPAEEGPERPRAPKAAVVRRGARSVVFVVSGGVVREVEVKPGREQGGLVEVESGLAGGEAVVLDPAADLADGARVRTQEDAK